MCFCDCFCIYLLREYVIKKKNGIFGDGLHGVSSSKFLLTEPYMYIYSRIFWWFGVNIIKEGEYDIFIKIFVFP